MGHWNNTHQPHSYQHGSVTANFMHNGYTGNPWSSLPTTSPYLEDNKLTYSQENHPTIPFTYDRRYQLPAPKTKLPNPKLRLPAKSRRPEGAPPPYSAVDGDVPPLPLPSFNHPNYPFPPPTSFNNCSFHYNGIPKENPLWAAPRSKPYDMNRSAGDDQLAPIPITRKQSVRIGGFACGKTLDTGQTRRNLSTRASRRYKFIETAIKRAPQSSNCTKKAPASILVGIEESTNTDSRYINAPSALKTRKTRATQFRNELTDNPESLDAYCSTTNLPLTPLTNHEIHRKDLLGLLAAEPSKQEAFSIKNDSIRNEKFASDHRIITKPKSVPKRNARNIFKLQSQHKGEVTIKPKLEMRRSEIASHIEPKKKDLIREESRPEAKNTNIQLAESVTSLQRIYFQELRKRKSAYRSRTLVKTYSELRTSRSCPNLARKRKNLGKSTSFCFGQTSDIPVAPLHSQVIASSHKIDSVKRAIAELLKRDLSKEAVDVVTVANREYYVMPVICSMPRTPLNVNTRSSWRTFQCCPSCCTTGCGPFSQMPEPPKSPRYESSQSLSRNRSSAKSIPVSKSPSNESIENYSFEVTKASTNHLTCPSTFKADFFGYHEATECGTQAQSRPFGTPTDYEKKNILDLNPITLTPPSTSKHSKSIGDVVSLLGSSVPRTVTPVLCYTCRTCCSKPACCSRSCSPCRFPCLTFCPPQCPPRSCSPCAPCCPPPCPPRSCSPCARACPPCFSSCSPCSPCGSCSPICRPYCPPPVPPRPCCQCPPPPPPVPPPNRQCLTAPCCYPNSCSPPCSSPKDTCSSPSCSARCPQACSPSPPPCPFQRPCYRPPTPERCLPCQPAYRPCQPDDACYPLPPLCCPRPPSPCKVPQCNPCSPPPFCPPPWCCDPCCPPRCPSPNKYCPRPCSPSKCSWDPCCPYPCIPPCPPSPCRSPCYSPPRYPPTYCPPGYCSVCCKYPCCCPKTRCCPRQCPPPCTVYPCPAPPSSLCKPCPPSSSCRPCSPCRRPWSPPCSPCRPQCPPCQPYCSSRPCSPYCAPPRPPPCVPKRRRCCAPCGFTCPAPCPPPCPSPLCRRCCGKKKRRKRKCCCCLDDNPNFVFPPYKPYATCKPGCFCPEVSYEPFPGCCP